jgi:hypothetical protein
MLAILPDYITKPWTRRLTEITKEIQIIHRLFLAITMYCWDPSMNHKTSYVDTKYFCLYLLLLHYSHLSNKREVTLTDFEKFHPPQKKFYPPRLLIS